MSFYSEMLDEMNQTFSKKKNWLRDKFDRPSNIHRRDVLDNPRKNMSKLYKQGKIVYAALVTGNTMLFRPQPQFYCLPARYIFSMDDYFKYDPEALRPIAEKLLALMKLETVPEACIEIVSLMKDGANRAQNVRLPMCLTEGKEVFLTTALVYLGFLPKAMLASDIFPIICNPDKTTDTMMLRKRYWPKDLIDSFVSRGVTPDDTFKEKPKARWILNFHKGKITFRACLFIFFFIICVIASVVVYTSWKEDQKTISRDGIPDFTYLSEDELEDGKIVMGDIYYVFDEFAATFEEKYGVQVSDTPTNRYLLIPNGYRVTEEGEFYDYIMALKVDASATGEYDTVDEMLNSFWYSVDSDTIFSMEHGFIFELSDEFKGYMFEYVNDPRFYDGGSFIDWCAEVNVLGTADKEEIASKIVPYVVDPSPEAGSAIFPIYFLIPFALLMLIFAGLDINALLKNRREEQEI